MVSTRAWIGRGARSGSRVPRGSRPKVSQFSCTGRTASSTYSPLAPVMRHQLPGWIHFRVDGGACTGPAGEEVIGPLVALAALVAEAPLRRLIGEMGAAIAAGGTIPDAVAPA